MKSASRVLETKPQPLQIEANEYGIHRDLCARYFYCVATRLMNKLGDNLVAHAKNSRAPAAVRTGTPQ